MSKTFMQIIDNYKGERVVLLSLSRKELTLFIEFIRPLISAEMGSYDWNSDPAINLNITITVSPNGNQIAITQDHVIWTLTREKADEVFHKLLAMQTKDKPCHHYVDIDKPEKTLVLSLEEYKS
jgi:hypothetical protein